MQSQPPRAPLMVDIQRGVYFLVVFATVAMLEWAQAFFIPLAFAFLLTLCLNPLVSRLRRLGVPRALGAALLLGALVALIVAAIFSLQDDAQELLKQLPASTRQFRRMLMETVNDRSGWWQRLNLIARSAGAAPALAPDTPPVLPIPGINEGIGATLLQGSLGAAALLGQLAIVLFLVFFLLVVKLPVATRSRVVTRAILIEIGSQAQRYIGVMVISNVLLGLSTWLAFTLLGVNHAAVWGIVAGVLHFVPYAGPAAIAGGSALAATVQFESLGSGLLIAAVSLALSTLVGIVLTTWLTGKAARMNAATMFVGLLFWGWLWGLPGLLLGAPMMMTLKVISDRLPSLDWLSRLLHHQPS